MVPLGWGLSLTGCPRRREATTATIIVAALRKKSDITFYTAKFQEKFISCHSKICEMMPVILWIIIGVLILLLLIMVVVGARGKRQPTDFYNLYQAGIIWMVFSIPTKNFIFLAIGLLMSIIGMVNKGKWKAHSRGFAKLDKKARIIRAILIGALLGILISGFYVLFITSA